MTSDIIVAKGKETQSLLAAMANRHGLIAGATGTGKTVTLRVLAEGFSNMGVPVFMADVKGDLTGMAKAVDFDAKIKERIETLKITDAIPEAFPVTFWDVFGEKGHPLRASVSEMGPLLLSRLLNLNETQSSVLSLVFKVADDNGLPLLDLKDMQAILQFVSENSQELGPEYGNMSKASLGTIQRNLLALAEQEADKFFAEPCLNIEDLMQTDGQGKGVINILAADKLMEYPKVYSTMLLWLLSELFEVLPEAGDVDKPKLVFFFDEAHLLFDEAPKVVLERIERVARLIRSKGVGIYFVTQNPLDIPDSVLGQLGNRVQHALRAFTPRDQKAVKAAAETFRNDGSVDVEKVITELAVGEALVSFLDSKGMPTQVDRALVYPPKSSLKPLSDLERQTVIRKSVIFGVYEKELDRESAYEMLKKRVEEAKVKSEDSDQEEGQSEKAPAKGSGRQGFFEAFFKSAIRSVGTKIGNEIMRGVLGTIMGKKGR